MTSEQGHQMPKPSNEIDMQSMTTFPHISSDYMSPRLRAYFKRHVFVLNDDGDVLTDADGNPQIREDADYWRVMELFTQDFRLGNLNKEEAHYVRYHLDLCTDIMTAMPDSFNRSAVMALERGVAVNETSQGKGGFLRRMFNTFFQHKTEKEEQSNKRNFFGLGKKVKE